MRAMLNIGWFLCLLPGCTQGPAHAATEDPAQEATDFRSALATGDAAIVAQWVELPLARPHPLPPIRTPSELAERFDELFPDELVQAVVASKPEHWQQVGWRGVMFDNGKLWLHDGGKLFASNVHGEREQRHRERLIAADRSRLHASLRGHAEPVLHWRTKGFRVRVDRMPDDSLRYASWRRDAPANAEPDLVLAGGDRDVQGTARNETISWTNGEHRYVCRITRVGPDDAPPLELAVFRGDEQLTAQAAEPIYGDS